MEAKTPPPQHLTETEVNRIFGIPVRTLQTWRHEKRVLPFVKYGKLVRYRVADLESYAKKNLVTVEN